MAAWSSILRSTSKKLFNNNGLLVPKSTSLRIEQLRHSSDHREFFMKPSYWQWFKFKDYLYFYLGWGFLMFGSFVFYAHVFIGPAKLRPIPEGYEPKHWEYFQYPIQRMIARHCLEPFQEKYEEYLAYLDIEEKCAKLNALSKKITELQKKHANYDGPMYYRPFREAKYVYKVRTDLDKQKEMLE